ncbi:MAG: 4-(cytidine 5'-diphospho)-2-C-methyl-D-erythritol kinase [Phycisphaerae bacterium]
MDEVFVRIRPFRPRFQRLSHGALRVWAPGKVNLNLLVGPPGADGYHPIDSIVAKVTLYDEVDLLPRRDGQISFSCEGADCGDEQRNLAVRAARMLAEATGCEKGADIRLGKHIPPAAGLGGGSSDAAAVLEGLDRLWELSLSAGELATIGSQLGSDVPLFLAGPSARITGRGEIVRPAEVWPFLAVLYLPPVECSTAKVYAEFDRYQPPEDEQVDAKLLQRQPPSRWRAALVNHLAASARRVSPTLAELHERFASAAGRQVHMTGSGSGAFVLCDDEAESADVWTGLDDDIRQDCMLVRLNDW